MVFPLERIASKRRKLTTDHPCLSSLAGLIHVLYGTNFSTSQSSKKYARNGRPRRKRKRPNARLKKNDSVRTQAVPPTKTALTLPSTVKCVKQLLYRGKLLVTPNCPPLVINLLPRATQQAHSMAHKAQGLQRASLSMVLRTATTVPIVTAAVTPNPPTAKTRRCTSKVINHEKPSLSRPG